MKRRTTIISIPGCIASATLTEIQEKNISCKYMGIDQSGRVLMQVEYEPDYEHFIGRIIQDTHEAEKNLRLFQEGLNAELERLFAEKGLYTNCNGKNNGRERK